MYKLTNYSKHYVVNFNFLIRLAVDVNAAANIASNQLSTSSSQKIGTIRVYGGTLDCLTSTYRLEGLRGIYSGLGVSLGGI